MAEPEAPQTNAPQPHDDFDDDLVGFASPRALRGAPSQRPVAVAPEPGPEPESEPTPTAPEPDPGFVTPEPEPEPEPAPPPAAAPLAPPEPESESTTEVEMTADDEPAPPQASDTKAGIAGAPESGSATLSPRPEAAPVPAPADDGFGRAGATRSFERPAGRRDPGVTAEGDARLSLVIYVCLIAASVSIGLTAVLALFLGWTGRLLVKGWTRSHLLYQVRTSLVGVIAGVVGVLTLPLGVGVFILSLTVIWVVARAAAGLIKLLRREEIRNPRTWSLP